jgi:hypothetical protein
MSAVLDEVLGVPVTFGPVSRGVEDPVVERFGAGGGGFSANASRATLHVPGVAAFAVDDGARVTVDAGDDPDHHGINAYLHGTVTALLLAQRGSFALHASVVRVDGRAIAVCGRRGAGKSTTVLALGQRGHEVVSDDVAVVDLAGDGLVHRPTGRPAHVWPEAADALRLDVSGATPVQRGDAKLSLSLSAGEPGHLQALVVLRAATVADVSLRALERRDAIPVIARNAYRTGLLSELYRPALFAWSSAIAGRAAVHVAVRPRVGWTVDRVADAIERVATGV